MAMVCILYYIHLLLLSDPQQIDKELGEVASDVGEVASDVEEATSDADQHQSTSSEC